MSQIPPVSILDAAEGRVPASGVYGIVHRPSGRVYVGGSRDVFRRWRTHVWSLNRGRHHAPALLEAWCVDGLSAFAFVVLERCPRAMLAEREQVWLDAFPGPLNTSLSAACPPLDPLVAVKIGRANAGRTHVKTEETRRRLSVALAGPATSPETRAKISAALRGRKCPWAAGDANPTRLPEVREKMRLAARGRVITPETRAKISAANRGCPGRPISEVVKRAISESNRRRRGEVRGSCPGISAANRHTWADPEIRAKRVAGIRAVISSAQRSASAREQWRRWKEQGNVSALGHGGTGDA